MINWINVIIADAAIERYRKNHLLTKKLEDLHDKVKAVETYYAELVEAIPDVSVEAEITNTDYVNSVNDDARDFTEFFLGTLVDERNT